MGRPPDLVPNDTEAAWRITDTGWIYVVADDERAGRGRHTILVDDLDAQLAELAARGIAVGEIEEVPDVVRATVLTDPDGNTLQFAQPAT